MSEQRELYLTATDTLLQSSQNGDNINTSPPEVIAVSRADLLKDYGLHIARAQHLAKLLGLPPLLTGAQQRKAARDR